MPKGEKVVVPVVKVRSIESAPLPSWNMYVGLTDMPKVGGARGHPRFQLAVTGCT